MDKTKACKDCPDRAIGCHAACAGYAQRRAVSEEIHKRRLAGRRAYEDLSAAAGAVRRKALKKHKPYS
jgi:hypothetical protein